MNLKLIKVGLIVYAIAAFSYVMYSLFSQTGLCGYLMDLQITKFGVAYEKLTAFAGIFLFALPVIPFVNYVKRRDQENINLNPQIAEERAARAKRNQWKVLLALGIAPAIISFIAYPIVLYVDRADQERKIYKINLNEGVALPANDVKFAEVTGVYQPDFQYILEESRGSSSKKQTTYVPLTESNWDAKQPIKFFLIAGFNGYTDPLTKRFVVLPNKGTFAGTFSVQLAENSLPTFVLNEYARKGLTVASPHYVLTRMNDFEGGGVKSRADSQMYYLIPILGVGMSVAILLAGGLGLLIRKARGL